ncbi:MAG TPA: hypothetical protein VMW66_00215, partial [Elusimicrobiales bacterium]|nr:hypothetical protein [Elusimicrobiales bacterium]
MSDSEQEQKDREYAKLALHSLEKAGAQKSVVSFVRQKKQEMNVDMGSLALMRTSFDVVLQMAVIKDNKRAGIVLNQISKDSIEKAAQEVMESAEYAEPDNSHDISEYQQPEIFDNRVVTSKLTLMYDRLNGFLTDVKKSYPEITLGTTVLDFMRHTSHFLNSNGVYFTVRKGIYD